MSLLNQTTNTPSQAQQTANEVRTTPAGIADSILFKWNAGWDKIWSDPDPASILAALGTDAAEVFALNEEIVAFLNTSLAGRRQANLDAVNAKVAAKPATTVHQDGTVTIN